MLTYEYQCAICGNRFDRVQRITDEPLGRCPKCGGKLQRLIAGGTGVIFKGNGFYMNDYHGGSGSSWGSIDPFRAKPEDRE